ncbi:hypothetical protein INS49_003847 [Diaporthe citri]|uniref:uncharacterized protein n=1 Tax=Diaporthe citri TaxID=83186 RepID=UPI001C7ECDEE|nr:uncharacterized protein INS49_003847 [Diaporthe citri]KAG6354766.1 hypothetical protein INS49_003847 [Diaporthe citri]
MPPASSRPMSPENPERNHISRYLSLGAVFRGDGKGGGQQFCGPYFDNRVSYHHLPHWAQKKRFLMACSSIALIFVLGVIATLIAVAMERRGGNDRNEPVIYHVDRVCSRDWPLYRYFSVTSLECNCGLDRIHGTRRTQYCFAFTVSIGSPHLDFRRFTRGRSLDEHLDHLGAHYDVCSLSIQLSQHLVLLGVPGSGL